jgi:phage repressor protein C with HTH and peptisase S24 domain
MSGEPRKPFPVRIAVEAPEEGAFVDTEHSGCAENEPYALRVIGDSMAPEFLEGHVIIVEPALSAPSGAYVVCEYEGETWLRQLVVEEGGRRFLHAVNTDYPRIEITGRLVIRGVVSQRVGKRRRDRKHYS